MASFGELLCRFAKLGSAELTGRDTVTVPYSRSFPLARWLGSRRESISALARAYAQFVKAGAARQAPA